MSQHDLNIANQGFPAFRADLNNALVALGTNSSGATEPSTTFAHQFWMDTAADPSILKVRNADNDAWITLGTFNQTADTFTPAGVTSDKIEEGNSKVEVVDTGTGYIVFEVDGAEVARFNPDQLVTKAGTASTPAISPTGDLNTGIFFPAADTIAFAEGGAEAMRIDSSGRLGIGTDSPSSNPRITIRQAVDDSDGGIFIRSADGTTGGAVSVRNDGSTVFRNGGAERMRIASSGNIFFGGHTAVDPTNGCTMRRDSAAGTYWYNATTSTTNWSHWLFNNGNGTVGEIRTLNSATTYATSSDYRLKENIAPMTGALAKVAQLQPRTWSWKADGSHGEGFVAHELQAVCPDAVTGEKDATEIRQVEVSPAVPATYDEEGNELTPAVEAVYEEREVPKYQGVDTSFLVATLTAAIQELKAINDAQASRIETLEAKVAALESGS